MPDAQAAHEHTLTAMLPALAGANLIYGMGMLDSGMTWDYAQLLMQNETVGMILKSIQGFPVTDEHFALDVVKDVGPGGEFITHDHTLTNMRQQSQPRLFDRRDRDSWEADGSPAIEDKAYARALDIIENHKPEPLPAETAAALNKIYDEAVATEKAKPSK
jgi:trimethylamine---corrinoid protein Co-methyltransferase